MPNETIKRERELSRKDTIPPKTTYDLKVIKNTGTYGFEKDSNELLNNGYELKFASTIAPNELVGFFIKKNH